MAILRSDLPEFNKGSDSLAELIMGSAAKSRQARQQKDLDVQKAQEMLPVEQQQAQNQADVGYNQAQRMVPVEGDKAEAVETGKSNSAVEGLKQVSAGMDDGSINPGTKMGAGAASPIKEADPGGFKAERLGMQNDRLTSSELNKIPTSDGAKKVRQLGESLAGLHKTLDMLDNPNAYDQANIGTTGAREAEGIGQKLFAAVINQFKSEGKDVPSWALEGFNRVTGGKIGTMSEDAKRASRDHFLKLADQRQADFDTLAPEFEKTTRNASKFSSPEELDTAISGVLKQGNEAKANLALKRTAIQNNPDNKKSSWGAVGSAVSGGLKGLLGSAPGAPQMTNLNQIAPQAGQSKPDVTQNGQTYKWNPQTNAYE